MTPAERHARLSSLVNQVLDLPPRNRPSLLQQIHQEDPDLHGDVVSLLEEEDALVDGFLDEPVSDALRKGLEIGDKERRFREEPPSRFGHFRILGLLGEGGMGTVFLAEQENTPYRRRVALKLVHGLRTGNRRKRFVAECQALARLNHPNVSSLYEAGSVDDPRLGETPYVAMEYIEGKAILQWCDEKKLNLEARLSLFMEACAGVQHAHEKGILHRDIKPTNVMVTELDGKPMAKIIDFGIAHALESGFEGISTLTEVGIAGSPAYLSPDAITAESVHDLDTRSDVYSLGLVLYELVTGLMPFDDVKDSLWVQMKRRREEDPPSMARRWTHQTKMDAARVAVRRRLTPERMKRRLRSDLDIIVMKTLDRDRNRRYGSPAALADDIRRYLRHQPIDARPPSITYNAGRFLRRRWRLTAFAAMLLLALAAGFVARTIEARKAREEAARTQAALAESRKLSDSLIALFEMTDLEREGGALAEPELLEKAIESMNQHLSDVPIVRARLLHSISKLYLNLGKYAEGEAVARDAVAIREAELPPDHPDLGLSLSQQGALLRRLGRHNEAQIALERAVIIQEKQNPPDHSALGDTYGNLGNLWWNLEQWDKSEQNHRKALALRRLVPDDTSALAASLNNFAIILRTRGKYEEALTHLAEAIAHFSRDQGTDHPRTTMASYNLAIIHDSIGNYLAARAIMRDSATRFEARFGPMHPETRRVKRALTTHLRRHHLFGEAKSVSATLINNDQDLTVAERNRGRRSYALVLAYSGDFTKARPLMETIAKDSIEHHGPDHPNTLLDITNLAWLDWREGHLNRAETEMRRMLSRYESMENRNDRRIAWVAHHLGLVLIDRDQFVEAEQYLRRGLHIRERFVSMDDRAESHLSIGKVLLRQDCPEEATPHLEQALSIYLERYPGDHPLLEETLALFIMAMKQEVSTKKGGHTTRR